MTTLTYSADVVGYAAKPARNSWFKRVVAALAESRMRKAEGEILRYRHLLPNELEWAAYKLGPRSECQLPFIR